MFKFIRFSVQYPRMEHPMEYGWMLIIEDRKTLIRYFDVLRPGVVRSAYRECRKSADVRGHFTDPRAKAIYTIAEIQTKSFVDTLADLEFGVEAGMRDSLPVVVNVNGGWFSLREPYEVLEVYKGNNFPIRAPRFMQWPGGDHWYVLVGNVDVVVDGKQKWSTREGAERAYNRWALSSDSS